MWRRPSISSVGVNFDVAQLAAGEPVARLPVAARLLARLAQSPVDLRRRLRRQLADRASEQVVASVAVELAGRLVGVRDRARAGVEEELDGARVVEEVAVALLRGAELVGAAAHLGRELHGVAALRQEPVDAGQQAAGGQQRQHREPPGPPEGREDRDRRRGDLLAPDAGCAAGAQEKPVRSRREVGVAHFPGAGRAIGGPCALETRQPAAHEDRVLVDKRKNAVTEGEPVLVVRQASRPGLGHSLSVHLRGQDLDGGRRHLDGVVLRLVPRQPAVGADPHPAERVHEPGRAIGFGSREPLADREERRALTVPAHHAAVGADPQRPAPVLDDEIDGPGDLGGRGDAQAVAGIVEQPGVRADPVAPAAVAQGAVDVPRFAGAFPVHRVPRAFAEHLHAAAVGGHGQLSGRAGDDAPHRASRLGGVGCDESRADRVDFHHPLLGRNQERTPYAHRDGYHGARETESVPVPAQLAVGQQPAQSVLRSREPDAAVGGDRALEHAGIAAGQPRLLGERQGADAVAVEHGETAVVAEHEHARPRLADRRHLVVEEALLGPEVGEPAARDLRHAPHSGDPDGALPVLEERRRTVRDQPFRTAEGPHPARRGVVGEQALVTAEEERVDAIPQRGARVDRAGGHGEPAGGEREGAAGERAEPLRPGDPQSLAVRRSAVRRR